jgi:hypothetical protein
MRRRRGRAGGRLRQRPEQSADDLGIERGAAAGDARHGVQEVVDVEHAVLEQIAEPAGQQRDEDRA